MTDLPGEDIARRYVGGDYVGRGVPGVNPANCEQCVSLVVGAAGVGGVWTWRKGARAMSGKLSPGTPIATFLTSEGLPCDRYADGTGGRPGIGMDHACIFLRMSPAPNVGIVVLEQYTGQKPHEHIYLDGGRGERGAQNYYAIVDTHGDLQGMATPNGPAPKGGPNGKS